MTIKSGIGVGAAGVAFVLFCFGAGWIVLRLIRSNRAAVIATIPVVAEQSVRVDSGGELVVSVEVPRMATEFHRWEFEVQENSTGRTHVMKWGGPRTTGVVKGISTIKVPVGQLTLERADTLAIRVKGLSAGADYSTHHVVLARPHLLRMALQIAGLVGCGIGILLSLVGGVWAVGVVK